ncbi:MAG TPA: DinB family protein [Candidatus Limnocylindria bacterium]|nr:DinB family protein [Candidatus Limnocylindria bacterium]
MTTFDPATSPETLALPEALTAEAAPELPGWLARARAAVASATSDALAVPESALENTWLWKGVDTGDGVRYGLYRGAETIEAASAELEAALSGAPARPPAVIRGAPATIARWILHGRLAALDDSWLDRVPKPGEWTTRQTLAHIVDGQWSYGWFTRWWLTQPRGPSRPARVSDEAEAASQRAMPEGLAEGSGSLAEIRARLDSVLDEWALRYVDLSPAGLAAPVVWAGVPVQAEFRLGRWTSHIDEHTIQIDKTLDWLGYQPTEPARIARALVAAWGRLEARIFPVPPAGTEAAVSEILERMAAELTADARSVREAAEA